MASIFQEKDAPLISKVALGTWVAALTIIMLHVAFKPHVHTDYNVYHAGGARWLASADLYPKTGEFIYSPFAAACFAALAPLPDTAAGILWRLIGAAVYTGAFAAWLRGMRDLPRERAALAWILLLPLSVGDIFNGQANPLMIGLLIFAILGCRRERWFLAAACVGFATFFKVYPLAIGLLLCVLHPRKFPWRLALVLLAFFSLSLVVQRPSYALQQYANWIGSLRQDSRRTLNYFGTDRDFWLLLRVLRAPISLQGWAVLQVAAGAAVAVYLWLVRRRGAAADMLDFLLLTLGVCWMLLFGPETESATYVILAPPVVLAWLRWRGEPAAGNFATTALAGYGLLIASQMISSWAHQFQNPYTHLVQPVAAMVLAAAAVWYGFAVNARRGVDI
jgi:hypothetical protein